MSLLHSAATLPLELFLCNKVVPLSTYSYFIGLSGDFERFDWLLSFNLEGEFVISVNEIGIPLLGSPLLQKFL